MRISAELRDYDAAGSLAEELPYWGWLEDHRTCLTRSGELIAVGRLEPAVVDGRSPEQIDRVLGDWQRLLSGLDADTCLYFYMLRRPSAPEADDAEGSGIVRSVAAQPARVPLERACSGLRPIWSGRTTLACGRSRTDPRREEPPVSRSGGSTGRASAPTYLGSEIEAATARFRALVDAGRALVSEHTPIDLLPAAEASRLLSELINRPGTMWHGATGSGMNWRLALSELEAQRSHLRLDGEPVILYSLLSPPGQAHANLLRELYCLDAAMTVSLEWRPWAVEAARRRIRGAQRHYFAKRYSMMAHVLETEGTAAAMVDSAAATESERLGEALVELEADGVSYGEASLTVSLHGELGRIERVDGDLRRLFAAHDAKVIRESYGQLPAWFSRLPAQPRGRQVRKVFVSAGVAACLAPLFGPPRGSGEEPAPRPRGARGARDPVAHGLPLRPVRGRRGAHADARRDWLGQELHAQLPAGRGAQVRPPGPDPGPGRLLPLADPLPRGSLPGALARRGGAHAPAAAVRAPGDARGAFQFLTGWVLRLLEARWLEGERRGHERDPGLADRGSLRRSSRNGARSASWQLRSPPRCGRPGAAGSKAAPGASTSTTRLAGRRTSSSPTGR